MQNIIHELPSATYEPVAAIVTSNAPPVPDEPLLGYFECEVVRRRMRTRALARHFCEELARALRGLR